MTQPLLTLHEGELEADDVAALLEAHVAEMRASSPPGASFALPRDGLRGDDITFYTVRDGEALLGCGALRELSPSHGEIKSMRTHAAHLRRGVARFLLDHLIAVAIERGYRRLSLETGDGPAFEAAQHLYRSVGFRPGEPFASYEVSAFSRFFHLDLAAH